MRTLLLFVFICLIRTAVASTENDLLVAKLHDSNMEVRIDALRQLQTTLDPRLPREMLRLLTDEGNSIRRLAARGVGSRYPQIPASQASEYLPSLRKLSSQRKEYDDVANMADRAIGLLTRKYSGDMFAPSPDHKWVIYERYSMPCLIDLTRGNEQLLGWDPEGALFGFGSSWCGATLKDSAYWHPKSRAVALVTILDRKDTTIWIWKPHGSKLIELEQGTIARALGVKDFKEGDYLETCGKGWKGDNFIFDVDGSRAEGALAWNLKTGKLLRISENDDTSN